MLGSIIADHPLREMPNFTCHDDSMCCFHANDVAQATPLTDSNSIEVAIEGVENKSELCAFVKGQCLDPDLCQMLRVKNMLLGRNPEEKHAEFACTEATVCCFENGTYTEKAPSATSNSEAKAVVDKKPEEDLLNPLRALLSRSNQPSRPPPPPPRRRIRPRRLGSSYDYYDDYYDQGRRRPAYADYYDYDYNYRRPPARRRLQPFEPIQQNFRRSKRPLLRAKAAPKYRQPRRRYKPKVTKKIEYHDHNHGESLLNHGLGGLFAKGFEDVFVSNLTAFCELYDGVCVEPGNCATRSGRSYDRFQCNATTLCCLPDYSIKRLHPLGQGAHKKDTEYSDGAKHNRDRLLSHISPENSALFTQTDRETLCALKNGTCIHPSLCNSHKDPDDHGGHVDGYGVYRNTYNSHHDFYCNLTTICCTPSLFDVETHIEIIPYDSYGKW
jgi:hypothetical protein